MNSLICYLESIKKSSVYFLVHIISWEQLFIFPVVMFYDSE